MADSPAFDATDPVAENNAKRDQERIARQDRETLRAWLGHKNGRSLLYRKLAACHIFATSYVPGGEDGRRATDFALGEENIGKQLMYELIDAAPDLYMKMIAEQKEEEARIASVREEEEKKREGDDSVAVKMQGFDLPPPAGYPGGPELPLPKS